VIRTDIREADRPLDVTRASEVRAAMGDVRPEVVIHCAAYTQVDRAETDVAAAYRLNALGSEVVAQACAEFGASLCYISTDFVFDGRLGRDYHEYDAPAPLSVYGDSKRAGELAAQRFCTRHWIVRTAWLYGVHGRSFPATILRAAREGRPLRVVADQTGSPTFALDLARAIWRLVGANAYGVHHVVNAGSANWYQFARTALDLAGMGDVEVEPIPGVAWPAQAARPRHSVLTTLRDTAPAMRPWREALADFVERTTRESAL
jgi:dTDP-4-dehydrorhamnose reductase